MSEFVQELSTRTGYSTGFSDSCDILLTSLSVCLFFGWVTVC
jgi:hypothetical protein